MASNARRRRRRALALVACASVGVAPNAALPRLLPTAHVFETAPRPRAPSTAVELPLTFEQLSATLPERSSISTLLSPFATTAITGGAEPSTLASISIALPAPPSIGAAPMLAAVESAPVPSKPPATSTPAPAVADRYLVQVLVPRASLHERPDLDAPIIGQVEQGTQLEADARSGEWYRVKRVSGEDAWILNASVESGATLAVAPFPADGRIGLQPPIAAAPVQPDPADFERRRPQGERLEPRLPLIDPKQVLPPTPFDLRAEVPVRDRWRILKGMGMLPYDIRDPYNPNVLKGDLPVLQKQLGPDWFFNVSAISDTVLEARKLPTSVGIQSTRRPGSNETFGRGRQSTLVETAILGLSLIKGNTVFRPPDYEFRFVPVVSFNRTMTQEVRAVNIDPEFGVNRNDSFVGVQELFIDKHLRDVSTRYDFDSVRLGVQPFTSDFRGFLFLDQPFGLRFFGTRDNNKWQYNAAWFRRLEKDTNSGLNDITHRLRADDVYVANLYRQDWPVLGFTTQGTVLHNRNREGQRGQFYNVNGFLERPAIFGTGRPHDYKVTYFGLNGDGHFGRWNVTASGYYAHGTDSRGMFSNMREDIRAYFGAIEVSRDFDWVRVRATALHASGDKNPFDGKATGFDAVLENPLIAGADTSYWIRQAVPLIGGGGTTLSIRNGVLASLRTSREHGQSNFTNPGLNLLGIGADFDVRPQFRVLTNLNYIEFDNLSTLATLRNQRLTSLRMGVDASIGVQYRPLFNQNIVVNASAAALFPGKALREIYGNAVDARQYSVLLNILLTY